MPRVEYAEEKVYIPQTTPFLELYVNNGTIRFLFALFGFYSVLIGSVVFFMAETRLAGGTSLVLLFGGLMTVLFQYMLINFSGTGSSTENLVANTKDNNYFLNCGLEVFKHLGDGGKSSKKTNLTGRHLLLDSEVVKRMGAILGTTGSGKTVFLQALNEIMCVIGGASLITDAKGTLDEFKRTIAIWYATGREKTSYLINLLNLKNSHAIDLCSVGNALQLTEVFSILIENDDAQWSAVEKTCIANINKLLVYKRDNEGLVLLPSVYTNYFSMASLLEEAWQYRKKHRHDKFLTDYVKWITTAIGVDYEDFCTNDKKEFAELCKKNSMSRDFQGVYNISVGSDKWMTYMTLLASNYEEIFNRVHADINIYEAVQNCKNIWVVLPSMESDESAKRLGKIFLGLIKSTALTKTKKAREPKFPFLILLDEFGSIVVEGFGRFMSKGRSLGLSVWILFQSKSQLMVAGKEECDEIIQMCNTSFVMKMKDDEYAEQMMKFLEESYELRANYSEQKRIMGDKLHNSNEQSYSIEEVQPLKQKDFINQNKGEMFMFSGSEYFRAIAKTTTWMTKNLTVWERKVDIEEFAFPLHQSFPKKELFKDFANKDLQKMCFKHSPRFMNNEEPIKEAS